MFETGGFIATDLPVISTGGQCQVERCFQVARGDTSKQYVALKTDALSFAVSDHKSSGAE